VIDFFRGVDDPKPDRSFQVLCGLGRVAAPPSKLHQTPPRREGMGIMLPLKDEAGKNVSSFWSSIREPLPEIADCHGRETGSPVP